ncbi:MAG: CCA tRNA nucleotidyltransferase, mitochondrial [Icmadophila ericetorum]|nr:CCA tRNA nucleotidyltransferase, mitochondrial [Icmadophila ericetorum]
MKPSISLTLAEQKLRKLLLDVADYIGRQPECSKPELRITGGWVRDRLLGIESKDIDIGISSMTGFRFATLMQDYLKSDGQTQYDKDIVGHLAKIEANPEKSKHLETVTTNILGLDIDLVNLRKESYTEDSRNPIMEFGSPEEDALRRDSTVNALFYNLTNGEVEDFTGKGLDDMRRKIIRTPLAPYQTFKDDPLRILRCIRFASKLDYRIDEAAKKSMGDESIKEALKKKISRERVGIEFEKMVRGPDPCGALNLIDELNLYNTIFADPTQNENIICSTENWSNAYSTLNNIGATTFESSAQTVKLYLLGNKEDSFLAWYLCSLVPWAKVPTPKPKNPKAKPLPPFAATVSREGLRSTTKVMNVIKDAVIRMKEIQSFAQQFTDEALSLDGSSMERKLEKVLVNLGSLIDIYAAFLTKLSKLDLLEAYAIKPIIDGNQITIALRQKHGPWMTRALEVVMEWQLEHPQNVQKEDAIAQLVRRKGDFLPPS